MIRRLPILPTVVVAAAVALMIALGFWQIRRAQEKESLLARLASAQGQSPILFPTVQMSEEALPLYRKARGTCLRAARIRTSAGSNLAGETGFIFIADCVTGEGPGMAVQLGWSKNPNFKPDWNGGPVEGVIAPDSKVRLRLVSATGLGGLQASAPPSIESIPNNHRSYAVQWFLFAAIALVIYGLAVRNKLKPAQ